jgi:uncharacterized membrane protein
MMHTWYHNGTGWIGTGIIVVALLTAVVVLLLRQRARGTASEAEVLQVLETRLARGEIDAEEYRRVRALLLSSNGQ